MKKHFLIETTSRTRRSFLSYVSFIIFYFLSGCCLRITAATTHSNPSIMFRKCTLYSQSDLADYCLYNLTKKKEKEIYRHLLICKYCRKNVIYIQELGNIFNEDFSVAYEKALFTKTWESYLPVKRKKTESSTIVRRFRLVSLITLFIIFIGISIYIILHKVSTEIHTENFSHHSLFIPAKEEPGIK